MRKLILALGTLAIFTGSAFAIDTEGVVRGLNKEKRLITLDDGKTYTIPGDVPLPADIKVGTKIKITLDDDDTTQVEQVTMASM